MRDFTDEERGCFYDLIKGHIDTTYELFTFDGESYSSKIAIISLNECRVEEIKLPLTKEQCKELYFHIRELKFNRAMKSIENDIKNSKQERSVPPDDGAFD